MARVVPGLVAREPCLEIGQSSQSHRSSEKWLPTQNSPKSREITYISMNARFWWFIVVQNQSAWH